MKLRQFWGPVYRLEMPKQSINQPSGTKCFVSHSEKLSFYCCHMLFICRHDPKKSNETHKIFMDFFCEKKLNFMLVIIYSGPSVFKKCSGKKTIIKPIVLHLIKNMLIHCKPFSYYCNSCFEVILLPPYAQSSLMWPVSMLQGEKLKLTLQSQHLLFQYFLIVESKGSILLAFPVSEQAQER